ncbi:MAG: Gx transporter family protein [Eubacteriales bacterium]
MKGKIKRLTRNALLTTAALILFVVEAQIPVPVPIPGVKLGLANVITVYAMFLCGPADTLAILLCRILLGSIFAGQMMSFLYSFCGGIVCYLVMFLMRRIVTAKQIWVCSVVGAMAHNVGQIAAAMAVLQTPAILGYLPLLLVSGIVSGAFTGFCAQFAADRMKKARQG